MPVIIMLNSAVFERISVVDVSFIPLIAKTIIIVIVKTESDANAIAAAIKNDFKFLCSFCL